MRDVCGGAGCARQEVGRVSDFVILLHGLGRTSKSMATMAEAVTLAGYYAYNTSYHDRYGGHSDQRSCASRALRLPAASPNQHSDGSRTGFILSLTRWAASSLV